ncbi:hypothetical protein Tco_0242768 [Tanacetum coccineum]
MDKPISTESGIEHRTAVKNLSLKYLRNTKDMLSDWRCFVLNGGALIELYDSKFISRLGVVPTIEEPISMYCDNIGAIAIAKDHGVTKGARHFRAKVHYLREP